MCRLILILFLFSHAAKAVEITNFTFSNVRESSRPGLVDVDFQFNINYRRLNNYGGPSNRQDCLPNQIVEGYVSTSTRSSNFNFIPRTTVDVSRNVTGDVTLVEMVSKITPVNAVVNGTLLYQKPGSTVSVTLQLGNLGSYCYRYDEAKLNGPGTIVPPVKPHCDISVISHLNHGEFTLRSTTEKHSALGNVAVTCDSPADVTVSTGASGSIKINDTLSTNIFVDGKPNEATKTVSGTENFQVKSEMFLTSVSNWAGKFDHPVVMTISWP